MTQVDFYILQGSANAALNYACRLIEKAAAMQLHICVQLGDEAQLQALDKMLWHLKPENFLPHERLSAKAENKAPILLGLAGDFSEAPMDSSCDVLINLCAAEPSGFGRFKRLAELVATEDAEWLNASRQRWKHYQDRGYPLKKHDIKL